MSLVSYNGITLPYSHITQFAQDAVYDDMGHTDWIKSRFDIIIQTVITLDYLVVIGQGLIGPTGINTPANLMKAIRFALMQSRKSLSVKFGGEELIPQIQQGNQGTVDAANGPQPKSCVFTMMTNTTFMLTYRIMAEYWENLAGINPSTDPNLAGNPVLYNRWTESVDIDNVLFSTRTRDGKFIIRSDNYIGGTVDFFRPQMAVCGTVPGFLRVSQKYEVDPSGLGLKYHIVDKEVFKLPPTPAYEAKGTYTEFFTNVGAMRHGHIDLILKSAKNVPQINLLTAAVKVAAGKMFRAGTDSSGVAQGIAILEDYKVSIQMYSNEVRVVLQGKFLSTGNVLSSLAGVSNTICFIPGTDASIPYTYIAIRPNSRSINTITYEPAIQPNYTPRGTAGLLLQAAAYYDPSLTTTAINLGTSQLDAGVQPGQAGLLGEEPE